MKALLNFLDWLIPRFFTEDVALMEFHDGYEIVCSMKDLLPHECYDGVMAVSAFNFFGCALWPRQVGPVRPWPTE